MKSEKKEDGKKQNKKDEKPVKALFVQRLIAFLIDSAIIVFAASLLATPLVDNSKVDKLNEKSLELVEKYQSKKITTNEYLAEYMNITYDLAKNNGFVSLISVLLGLVMFVIVPLYNKGQTIGKKLLKIKIISVDGELNMNQLIFRSFIANSVLVDLISVVLLIVASKNNYFYCYGLIVLIQYIITITSIFMIMCRKDGRAVHDLLAHTQVVRS